MCRFQPAGFDGIERWFWLIELPRESWQHERKRTVVPRVVFSAGSGRFTIRS
jgi:hypothetical protein